MSRKNVAKPTPKAKLRIEFSESETFDPVRLLQDLNIEFHNFATSAGLFVVKEMMRHEADQLAGERYERNTDIDRWGTQSGFVRVGGQKVEVQRPRVRSKSTGKEVPLESYHAFQNPKHQNQQIYEHLIGGLSGRCYERTVDDMVDGYGVSRSAISRKMVEATAARLKEFCERDLSKFKVRVLLIDGVRVGKAVHATVMGIDDDGAKQVLGFREGATENSTVVCDLLADLMQRGLPNDPERALFAVIDGSKALVKALKQTFGKRIVIQRCQVHKLRNVQDYLPESLKAEYHRKMSAAYAMRSYADAERALRSIVRELQKINVSAANSLEEGLEETLTVNRLDLPEDLRRTLRTTNMIESTFSHSKHLMKNVRRWRGSQHSQRWMAAVLFEVEKKFRHIRGYKHMPQLIETLTRTLAQ